MTAAAYFNICLVIYLLAFPCGCHSSRPETQELSLSDSLHSNNDEILDISPSNIPVVSLFQNSSLGYDDKELHLTNVGNEELSLGIEIQELHNSSDNGWIHLDFSEATVLPGNSVQLGIHFTAEHHHPGLYQAFLNVFQKPSGILLSKIPITIQIFCGELIPVNSSNRISIEKAIFTDHRPTTWPATYVKESQNQIYLDAVLHFPWPVVLESLSEIDLDGEGFMETDFLPDSMAYCGAYSVRAVKNALDVWEGENSFCFTIEANTIFDIFHNPVPAQTVCASQDIGPKSMFHATFMTVSDEMKPITNSEENVILLQFSEEVIGLEKSSIQVTSGVVESVSPVPMAENTFSVVIRLNEDFYGDVKVSLDDDDSNIIDTTGNGLLNRASFTFSRRKHVWVEPLSTEFTTTANGEV